MKWALKRRIVIAVILAALFLLVSSSTIFLFREEASCFDNVRNGNETEVDCGGDCEKICESQAKQPYVDFAQIVTNNNQKSVVLSIVNPNEKTEVRNLSFVVSIFSNQGIFLGDIPRVVNLESGQTFVLLIPLSDNSFSNAGKAVVDLKERVFIKGVRKDSYLRVRDFSWNLNESASILNVSIENKGEEVLRTPLTAVVFGEEGKIIAAQRIIVPVVSVQGEDLSIVWNESFKEAPFKVDFSFEDD